ncbi:MAG: response regulator transcription factor [Acidobacteria bacterium]|nr:response regulator transcription factor [Acidobacteriota bacterium]
MHLLLIEDDTELCRLMEAYFAAQDVSVTSVHNGPGGLALALTAEFDLVLLDVMLPGFDGFSLLRQLRVASEVPVILLTARTSHADRIHGLEEGADDYLPKPFAPDELLARIRAVLRRARRSAQAPIFEASGVKLCPTTREAWCDGHTVELTGAEFDILEVLVRNAGRTVTRDEIATTLYQREASPYERSLDVHISNLRKKLGSRRAAIRTLRGNGYFFAPA